MPEPTLSVVADRAGELSIWPADRPVPPTWTATSYGGSRAECLAAVELIAPPLVGPDRKRASEGSQSQNTVVRLFTDSRRRYPDHPAVSDPHRSLTYAALDRASDAVSLSLRERGLAREDRVAVYLPRGVDVFVALLGIMKAGGACVPIDTRYPASRRDLMIRASGAAITITAPDLLADLARAGATAVTLERLASHGGATGPAADVEGDDAACVLFTSGSTGAPKPIVLEHRNLYYFARNTALPSLQPSDRVAHVSSLSFDALHFESWCPLAAGAEIVVLPSVSELMAGDVRRELRRYGITAMLAPTMAVNHLVSDDRDSFASLRILHTGGDVILPSACHELLSGSFGGEFYNLYGPTECTTACTRYRIAEVAPGDETVPIGTALAGASVYVLDSSYEPVPDGTVGELYVGGAGVARGYLGLPRETATRFLPDPFAAGGGRMYRTGDLVRRRRDGNLEFVSRADDQVKIHGYRVEPREVERILLRHEAVHDAAVLVEGQGDSRYLVAVVAGTPEFPLRQLREYAAAAMPDYLVPAVILVVERIPANEHGKRDTTRLRELARQELTRRRSVVPARDDVERHLVELWQDLLAVEDVGVEDDFFALGGNSMLAFRLRRRLSSGLGVRVDMYEVLSATVLAELAELVRTRRASVTS